MVHILLASRRARVLVTTFALAGAVSALPAAAHAASSASTSGSSLTIGGDTGANNITIAQASPSTISVSDPSGVTPSGGCTANGANAATCPAASSINVTGGNGADTITLQSGLSAFSTSVDGGAGNDTLNGYDGRDLLFGGDGDDTLNGNDGPDSLDGGAGSDTLNGGASNDTASYVGRTNAVNISLDGTRNDGEAGENDLIAADVESATGGDGGDTITGPTAPDDANTPTFHLLSGGAGNDTIAGGPNDEFIDGDDGDDSLNGGAGSDVLTGAAGTDSLNGGADNDNLGSSGDGDDDVHGGDGFDSTFYAANGPAPSSTPLDQSISLDDQANDGSAGEKDNVHSDVENVSTAQANDTIIGSDAANQIDSGAGNDTIDGKGGPDFMSAGTGADTILARDATADLADCGTGTDRATTDTIDTVTGCEANDAAAPPASNPGVITTPRDTTKAKLTFSKTKSTVRRKDFLKKGYSFTFKPNEAVTFTSDLLGTTRSAKIAKAGDLVLASKSGSLNANVSRKITLKLSKKTKRALPRKSFRIRLHLVATDAGGNRTSLTRTIRVK